MTAIPKDALCLADRLRMAAEEILSAARYGVPIPDAVNVSGHIYGGMSFSATETEFAAWADYTEAEVREYEYGGLPWSSVDRVDVNGLPVRFAVRHDETAQVSA